MIFSPSFTAAALSQRLGLRNSRCGKSYKTSVLSRKGQGKCCFQNPHSETKFSHLLTVRAEEATKNPRTLLYFKLSPKMRTISFDFTPRHFTMHFLAIFIMGHFWVRFQKVRLTKTEKIILQKRRPEFTNLIKQTHFKIRFYNNNMCDKRFWAI